MDVCEDELTDHSRFIMAAGPECEQGVSVTDLSQSDGNILLQLLEFKAHLLEVVEELHIRRDAEKRFEEQINKLVLEKQELEWEKESLQHQIESEKNLCAESLSKANKQGKIRNIEEEMSRYQVSVEQKDKDIQNLKEELKSLQLTKYNLEKKSSELEQKLSLQSRSKDSRLNQLSDVEKRFCALTRQCSLVKQAHEKLEKNVDEAMKLNKNLTSTNEKQEVTIASLSKEVEELRNKLLKTKMMSINFEKQTESPSIKEQTLNQLHQKLNMECEMNRRFKDAHKALQAEKQEVLTSLQLAHQLLSKQTQTLSRLELDMETQRKQLQSLEQDHKAMQVKEKTAEEKIKQLMEEYTISKNCWDKEKACMKKGQQELLKLKDAYGELHENHMKLLSKAKEKAQHINELKIKRKELDLTVLPSNSTGDGSSSGNGAFCEPLSKTDLSNRVHHLLLANGIEGQSTVHLKLRQFKAISEIVCNEEYLSEIIFESKVNSTNNPTVPSLRENTTEHINEVSDDAVLSSVSKSREAQMNSSATSRNFASTSIKLNARDSGPIDKAMEAEDGGVQDMCEETREKGAEPTGKKEHAQKIKDVSEQSATEDATLNCTAESVDEERGSHEKCISDEEKTQTSEEKNLLYATEDTRNHTQVSAPKKPTSALPCTTNELPGDLKESRVCESKNDMQNTSPLVESRLCSVCHDLEENTEMVSEESTIAELPKTLNKSSSCQSQSDAAQLDSVTVQETIKMQTQMVSPPDTLGHVKDTVDKSAKESSLVTQMAKDTISLVSPKEISEEKNNLTDSVRRGSKTSNNLTNECEKKNEKEQVEIFNKSNLKCKQSDGNKMNTNNVESWDEFGGDLNLSKITKDAMHSPRERDFENGSLQSQLSGASECLKNPVEKEEKMIDEFAVPIKTKFKPEWGTRAQSYTAKADISAHSGLHTTSQMSQSNINGYMGHFSNTLPIFHRSKDPLTITRTTDVLNASSVCGTSTASSWRHRQTERRAPGEGHRDAAARMDTRVSMPGASLVSTSSATGSRSQTQIRSLSPDASRSPESELDPSGSQDTEELQSSFRAQISKIEQFLNSERLRLPKKRKIEN